MTRRACGAGAPEGHLPDATGRTNEHFGRKKVLDDPGRAAEAEAASLPPSISMTAEFSKYSSTRGVAFQARSRSETLARSVAPIQLITLSKSASSLSGSLCCGC